MDWFNNRRLLEPIGNVPPAEAEANFYAALETESMAAQLTEISLRQTRRGSSRLRLQIGAIIPIKLKAYTVLGQSGEHDIDTLLCAISLRLCPHRAFNVMSWN